MRKPKVGDDIFSKNEYEVYGFITEIKGDSVRICYECDDDDDFCLEVRNGTA